MNIPHCGTISFIDGDAQKSESTAKEFHIS
jgi:hypothetical protein